MSEVKLTAQPRTEFGKGAARRLRRAHMVPAVLYGHGTAPVHVALPGHATMLALKHANALFDLELEGTSTLALPKDVQRDPLRGVIEHVDLLIVRRGEKVTVDVHLNLVGEPVPGALVTSEFTSLSVEVEATAIPGGIDLDVTGLPIGTQIHARDITLPSGATLVTDPDVLVLNVADADRAGESAEDLDAGAAEAASPDGGASPDGAQESPADT